MRANRWAAPRPINNARWWTSRSLGVFEFAPTPGQTSRSACRELESFVPLRVQGLTMESAGRLPSGGLHRSIAFFRSVESRVGYGPLRAVMSGVLLAAASSLLPAAATAQAVDLGPFRIDDARYFVKTATFTPYSFTSMIERVDPIYLFHHPDWTPADLVTGTSSAVELTLLNMGSCPGGGTGCTNCPNIEEVERLRLGFEPGFEPEEGPGYDLLLFDRRFSDDDYPVRIRPMGGSFTPILIHPISAQIFVLQDEGPFETLWAVPVDFADYGLPVGAVVSEVEVVAGCQINPPLPELDVSMGAAVGRSCETVADCPEPELCTEARCDDGRCRYRPQAPGTPCAGGFCNGEPRPACVQCVGDEHCPAAAPRCDLQSWTCVECIAPDDCGDSPECTAPECTEHACRYEMPQERGSVCSRGFCDGLQAGPQSCRDCLVDAHCLDDRLPYCDADGYCRACLEDAHCTSTDPCKMASCRLKTCSLQPIEGCPPDAGIVMDAGPPDAGRGDAGAMDADAPKPPKNLRVDDGCGCRTGASSPPAGSLLLIAFFLDSLRRYRRRGAW